MDEYQDFRPPAAPVADAWPGPSLEPAERGARFWAKCVDGLTGVGLLLGAGVVAALAIPAMVAYRRAGHASRGLALAAGVGFAGLLLLAFVALVVWMSLL